jgi:hypothetical protein
MSKMSTSDRMLSLQDDTALCEIEKPVEANAAYS